jgi:hypothetical protein
MASGVREEIWIEEGECHQNPIQNPSLPVKRLTKCRAVVLCDENSDPIKIVFNWNLSKRGALKMVKQEFNKGQEFCCSHSRDDVLSCQAPQHINPTFSKLSE